MAKHEHEWYPLAYFEPESSEEREQPKVAVWACAGRTDRGRCLVTATDDTVQREAGRRHVFEAEAEAEREQRHFNWEES